jgi:anti-sigma factor RsiW
MTARDQTPGSPTTSSCPSWETLSCYADAELAADEAAAVERHLAHCRPCGALLQTLLTRIATPLPRPDCCAPDCPPTEALLRYLVSPHETEIDAAVDAHVRQCDACVGSLAALVRQAQLDDPAAVPAAVVARAATAAQRTDRQEPLELHDALRPTPVWLRLPVLMPMAFAAGILLFVGTQQLQGMFAVPGERWRAVQARPTARPVARRVLTTDTLLRMAAQPTADIVTELRRGTALDIIAEQSDWLQVALPDGRHGWAPRHAFE